ncbi:UNVERIFIED_CONTAM: hypothetical protein HDU68_007633, partial [Siphonaria sp. JEL0065]
ASNGDVQEAITLLIANREALDQQQNSGRKSNTTGWLDQQQSPSSSASNGGATSTVLMNNAKSFLQFGRQKVLQVYEKASEKVAAVVEGLDNGGGSGSTGKSWVNETYSSSSSSRYRADTSDDDEDKEVPLERKSRMTVQQQQVVSPRGRSPMTSSLKLNSNPLSPTNRSREPSTSRHVSFETDSTPPPPIQQQQQQPIYTATPPQRSLANTHKSTGNELYKSGNYPSALDSYTTAIVHLPPTDWDLIPLLTNRATTYMKLGDYTSAIEDCNRVQELKEGDVKSLLRRAEAYEARERFGEAVRDYEAVVRGDPVGLGRGVAVLQGLGRCRKAVGCGGFNATAAATVTTASVTTTVTSVADDLAFLGGSGFGTSSPSQPLRSNTSSSNKPMSAAAAKAVDKAVESLRAQNESADREEEAKFQVKEAIEVKIETWKRGKEANIRALLSSLDTILWAELGWQTINLSELITPQQVKVRYMRAVAKVHPDKLKPGTTIEQKLIANEVFGALNKAWDAFKVQSGM